MTYELWSFHGTAETCYYKKKVTADVWSHIDEEKASDGFEILWQLKW